MNLHWSIIIIQSPQFIFGLTLGGVPAMGSNKWTMTCIHHCHITQTQLSFKVGLILHSAQDSSMAYHLPQNGTPVLPWTYSSLWWGSLSPLVSPLSLLPPLACSLQMLLDVCSHPSLGHTALPPELSLSLLQPLAFTQAPPWQKDRHRSQPSSARTLFNSKPLFCFLLSCTYLLQIFYVFFCLCICCLYVPTQCKWWD